jgi:Stress responsive A/B Barrel Domain
MIYHIVRMSFKPDIPPDDIEAGKERLRRYPREIDVIQTSCVGPDIGGEFDYGGIYGLADIEAYEAYMNAPWHVATDAAGLPLVSNFVSFDLTDDEDPTIGEKIAEVHRRRYENRPEVLALVRDLDSYTGSGVPDDSPASR